MLRSIWAFWRQYGLMMAERQTTIWLFLIYVVFVGPTWLVARVTGKRFFVDPGSSASYWVARPKDARTIAALKRMG